MTNVESGKAGADARRHMKTDPTATAKHGDPLVRYLGAVNYKEAQEKDQKKVDKPE